MNYTLLPGLIDSQLIERRARQCSYCPPSQADSMVLSEEEGRGLSVGRRSSNSEEEEDRV